MNPMYVIISTPFKPTDILKFESKIIFFERTILFNSWQTTDERSQVNIHLYLYTFAIFKTSFSITYFCNSVKSEMSFGKYFILMEEPYPLGSLMSLPNRRIFKYHASWGL